MINQLTANFASFTSFKLDDAKPKHATYPPGCQKYENENVKTLYVLDTLPRQA